jgi:hypothetical protein
MKNLLILTLFLFIFQGLTAQDSKYSNFEPTVFPDRIMLSIPGNPATTRSVSWRTAFDVTKSVGEIAVLDPSPKFEDKVVQVSGTNTPWEEGSQSAMGHKVIFENLQPKTKYAYRVGDGENWSEWVQFETSSANNEPFSFIYLAMFKMTLNHWVHAHCGRHILIFRNLILCSLPATL